MRLTRSIFARLVGYTLVGTAWLALLGMIAVFGVVYAVYADFKSPQQSRLTTLTRSEYLADVVVGRFRSQWAITPDPQLGYVPRPGPCRVTSPEFDITMTYGNEGYRTQPPFATQSAGVVVMVGDSFTAGLGVEDDQTYSALLQTRHGHRTFNTGVVSYGTARELWRLRRLNLPADETVIVLQYCDNDANENRRFVAHPFELMGTASTGQNWIVGRRQEALELSYLNVARASAQQVRFLARHLGLRSLARDMAGDRIELGSRVLVPDLSPAQLAADFLAVLDHFPEFASRPIVVIELTTRGAQTGILPELRNLVKNRSNIEVLDLRLQPPDFFRFDGHLTPRGHASVADQLHPAIGRARHRSRSAPPERR